MPTPIAQKYEVLSQLGQGGMGIVYKVRHKALETILALKTLPAELTTNPDLIARFTREARMMSRLRHGNIVQSIDFDFDGSLYYLVMEYIEGKTLKQYVNEKGALPLADVLEIAHQAATALAFAHNNTPPIIHRDIKPANIMIEALSKRVVVMDFGIAKELGVGGGDETKTGVMVGTVKYSSPEQLRHQPLAGSADIYSLGLVIYELYTGKQFFAGLGEHDVIGKVLYEPQEHEPHFTRYTPEPFAALVTKAIAKNPQHRYQRMEELLHDLEACQATLGTDDDTSSLTTVLPLPGDGPPPKTPEPVAVADIEKQIQQLQEEKERRLAASAQRRTQDAREQAARTGAIDYASALFQQGLSSEEKGNTYFHEKNYPLAQTAYQEAVVLFERAGAEAAGTVALHNGEQARQDLATVKAEAERYGARERARTFYGRALALQAQADDLWERQDYVQAGQVYAQARGVFEDACELARRDLLREEAATARQGTIAAQEAAADAAQLAPALFQEAGSTEQQANRAMELEEFLQARQLYRNAQEKYEAAGKAAAEERQRQQAQLQADRAHTEAARRQMELVREHVRPLYSWAAELWTQAQQQEATAEQAYRDNHYQEAVAGYEQAAHTYRQVEVEGRRAQLREETARAAQRAQAIQATAAARQRMSDAQAAAERVGAAERFRELFAQARQFAEQGREHEQRDEWTAAATLYDQGAQEFTRLREEAEKAVAHERAGREAEEAQQVFVQAQVEKERQTAVAARAAAQAGERARALQSTTATIKGRQKRRAESALDKADQLFGQGQHADAQAAYQQAVTLFAALQTQEPRARSRTALQYGTALLLVAAIGLTVVWWFSPPPPFSLTQVTPEPKVNRQPQLTAVSPQPNTVVEMDADEVQEFTAKATDPDPDDRLVYTWFVDGAKVPCAAPSCQFRTFASDKMQNTVQVEISDTKTNGTVKVAWTIKVKPPAGPRITRATPNPEGEITVEEGKTLTFAVEANSSQDTPLRYAWFLDGKTQTGDKTWTYRPDFSAAADTAKEVKVVVSGQNNRKAEQRWQVAVTEVNRRPAVTAASPQPDRVVQITADQQQEFSVEATDPDPDDRLVYTWFANGAQVECAKPRCRVAAFSAEQTRNTVQVAISDTKTDGTVQVTWNIALKALPPPPLPLLITRALPKPEDPIIVAEGKSLTFAVEAKSPSDTPLRYAWFLDGKPQRGDKTWTYRPNFSAAGDTAKEVKVVVSGQNEMKVEQTWRVSVQDVNQPPRVVSASPRPETAVELTPAEGQEFAVKAAASPRPIEPKPQPGEEEVAAVKPVPPPSLTPPEVDKWLETYRRAWEGMCEQENTATLLRLRITLDQSLDPTRRAICTYTSYRVVLQNTASRLEGQQAIISFDRADTIDGREMKPIRLTFTIEKEATGRIVRQR